jgi:phage tail sheath protein FI
MARTIQSPGIEIKEFDLSLTASLPVGTNVFVQGFANSGPTDELINVTSVTEFEQIYDLPTNAAERYFYHTAKQVLQSAGNLLTNRLPYGLSGGGGYTANYSALLFPVTITATTSGELSASTFALGSAYEIGEPVQISLTEDEFLAWESGQLDWTNTPNAASVSAINAYNDIGNTGIIVINDMKKAIDNNYAGYYLGIKDNSNLNDTTYNSISAIAYNGNATVDDWNNVPSTMIETALSGDYTNDSVSEDLEAASNAYPIDVAEFNDTIIMGLFKLDQSATTNSAGVALKAALKEAHVGSLDAKRTYTPTGQSESFFIGNQVNDDSPFLTIKVNPNLATQSTWTPNNVVKTVRTSLDKLYAIGPQVDVTASGNKNIGNLATKLTRSLRLAENKDLTPIDIVTDGGLSTIWTSVAQATDNDNAATTYDDTTFLAGVSALADQSTGSSSSVQNDWSVVYNRLSQFCAETRKDCIFIADPLKHIFVQNDLKVLEDKSKNFSSDVYWPLKNLFGAANSNYACTYGNWVKVYDDALGSHTWLPFSGYEAKIMTNMDSNLQPWYSPAGLNNGIVTGISDIAINPTQKQRDLLYKISINPVVYFPGDGYTVWGQKTLQKKPSAFDRINVRRLFLVLEKATNSVMRYFVFEPNTVFTRTRVVNILSPIFEIAKNNEGVYDYLIVCDERNNTPQTIDNNELVLDIYLKPVRSAEYILVNFYATRTDQDFTELI